MISNEEKRCDDCKSANLHFVRYYYENGAEAIRKQCRDCGRLLPRSYKRVLFPNYKSFPVMDISARESWNQKKELLRNAKAVLWHFANKRFKEELEYYRREYLHSDEWKIKRKAVLDYYEYKCAKCSGTATDLHHLHYDNIFKERLEDLMPLCRPCHRNEHKNEVEEKEMAF